MSTSNGTNVLPHGQKRKREEKDAFRKKPPHNDQPSKDLNGRSGKQFHNSKRGENGTGNANANGNGNRDTRGHNPLAAKKTALQQQRQKLPIWPQAASIRSGLLQNPVLILAGETGSGKSTQVPQFLLAAPWCTGRIAVTQPRRVAAVSLARRVADEMGTPLGKNSPAAQVGYNVRFDDNVGRNNRIVFLTEGMLLQEMLRDPGLAEYSCVVVDEVHERSVNVDLILGLLRGLVTGTGEGSKKRKGKPLRVVIMSATADTERLKDFFKKGFPQPTDEPDIPTFDGESGAPEKINSKDPPMSNDISTCFVEGRQFPVQTIYLSEPTQDILEASLLQIFEIHRKEPTPGDILVFLTGQDTVTGLQKSIEDISPQVITRTSGLPKLVVLPLFAALPQAQQQAIFSPNPPNTRKVILATNIAETSITVPGVRFVIDCGKAKIKQYRNRLRLDSLLVKPISKSSAIQRQGRAGREAAGKCWRLYTREAFETMEKDTVPEILRCDLSTAVLTMKARGVADVLSFPLLTPPPREAMEGALLQLLRLDSLNPENGDISDLGRKIARLPLTPALGRVIIAAADPEMGCLLPVIDIVACFSVENIFLEIKDQDSNDEAREARNRLSRRQGDHLTLLAAVQAYASERTDRKQWAITHSVSHRAMKSVMDVRKQLRTQCQQAKLVSPEDILGDDDDREIISESTANNILKCFLRGFSTSVAVLNPDGSYKTMVGNQNVAIHPSSVLYGRKLEAIMYNEFVYTNRTYARGVSAIQLNWLDEVFST